MSELSPRPADIAGELQDLARDVRRIGCGFRCDPETIASQKSDVAARLAALARAVRGGSRHRGGHG